MLKRLRTHVGTAGLIVAIVALVAALGGGAYAASSGSGGNATASAKQGKQGKPGKTGKTGPAGPAGPQGPAGAKGDAGSAGANGSNGTNGSNGANGKTVLHGTGAPGAGVGSEGDFYIDTAEDEIYGPKTTVWGGGTPLKGEEGEPGQPWVPNNTLPSNATETGAWATTSLIGGGHPVGYKYLSPISFTVPLAADIPAENVHIEPVGYAGTEPECPGTAAAPKAKKGHLCVYVAQTEGKEVVAQVIVKLASPILEAGASTSGAAVVVSAGGTGAGGEQGEVAEFAAGSWAVTAP